MVSRGKDGVQTDGIVEILLGPSDVSEIVFGYASEEKGPVISRVEPGKDVEILYCLGIFAIGKGETAAVEKDILVILRKRLPHPALEQQHDRQQKFPENMSHPYHPIFPNIH